MNKKTVTFIRSLAGFRGDARLYSTPDQGYVVVSAIPSPMFGLPPETCIFPADENGEVTDWGELDGSFRGAMDHERALRGAGYEVIA